MKKIILILTLVLVLGSCATTPPVDDGTFRVQWSSPNVAIDEIEVQINRAFPFNGIKKITANISYYPQEDAVCIQYKSDYFTYYQFWSRIGRDEFVKALTTYNDDFDARNLDSRNRNSKQAYGTVEGYLYWQQTSFTFRAYAGVIKDLGYAFNDGSPYFTVTQQQTIYVDTFEKEKDRASQIITLFFTRAQARALAAFFDQELLIERTPPELIPRFSGTRSVDVDDYGTETDEYDNYDEKEEEEDRDEY